MKPIVAFFLFIACLTPSFAQETEYNLLPFPAQFAGGEGHFSIQNSTQLVYNLKDIRQKQAVLLLADYLKSAAGLTLKTTAWTAAAAKGKNIVFQAHTQKKCGPEGYVLRVFTDRVLVEAETAAGFFYAVQTFLQLLPTDIYSPKKITTQTSWNVPSCDILDKPRFSYRGLQLDVSRHFMPVSFIKKYLDLMALHKLNTFHWHLTDDQGWRIEIKKYPNLTKIGSKRAETLVGQYYQNYPMQFDGKTHEGFYTQAEIRDVVNYAKTKHITIIPEIELPGHALAALAAYPNLSCDPKKTYEVATKWGVFEDVFCPNETTFKVLQDVLTEVITLFPGKYVHIGGDECPKDAWKKSEFCQSLIKKLKLKDEHELQSYFIKRIEKFVNSKGRVIIGWDEILEGGLAPKATVMSWRGVQGGIDAARQKHDVIMTPNEFMYLDHYQGDPNTEPLAIGGYLPLEKIYGYEPVPAELTAAEEKYILGAQANVWTEYMPTPEKVEYMVFPRAVALAELTWMPKGPRNFEDFSYRLKNHLKRLDHVGVNYSRRLFDVTADTQFTGEDQLQVRLEKMDSDSKMYYTTDGSEPTRSSTLYEMPITLKKTTTIRAMTTSGGQLQQTFFIHKAKGKKYTYAAKPTSDAQADKLTDGIVGRSPQSRREWVSLYDQDLDVVVDLGEVKPVSKVKVNFLKVILEKGFPPTSVEIAVSRDGKDFKEAISQPITYELEGPWTLLPAVADFRTSRARYVRIRAKNAGACPPSHPDAGAKTWFALDEIVVE
ncbi:glycoside hydrolase family 20 protein [Arundinibacter roseus]|uniref:beta-N-acetylhexosaminidase n=1 Tax=Arundinibacter roseus TaxID=2070510 RepID=A0A4R4K0T4_9BACT|nr:family 20 glycosylhydrolase [Arundinibacter roseus]TDB60006.1 beta-N-acetylhexosaminidase [Arundinibacter roseus]